MIENKVADACLAIAFGLLAASVFFIVVAGIAYGMQILKSVRDKEQ